jgi:hypothetical protein
VVQGVVPVDLSSFLERSVPHESRPVPVDSQLRISAFGGMALMAVLFGWILLGRNIPSTKPGFFILGYGGVVAAFDFGGHAAAVMALAATGVLGGVVLALYTDGLQEAPESGHYAAFALAAAGALAALPLLWTIAICLLNLALWIAYGILVAIFVCFCIYAFLCIIFNH